jgi:hypothetical protein
MRFLLVYWRHKYCLTITVEMSPQVNPALMDRIFACADRCCE